MKGILLDADNELMAVSGSLAVGDTAMQNACLVLGMNQGELKEDPVMGVNLPRFIRGRENRADIRRAVEIGLRRAGLELEDIKNEVQIIINRQKTDL
ncbi:MAG: hypothetical protein LBL04_11380 [Bacteroidales bacterium]|jgi:hypothetical protein|nr:hypothetical protein [Bacteroidales bacterium]